MKGVLICPDARKEVAFMARLHPLALTPFLGKPLLDHVITSLAAAGINELSVIVSDRPDEVRRFVHDGQPWGITAEVVSEPRELTIDEARAKYVSGDGWAKSPGDVVMLDQLPDKEHSPLFADYRDWLRVMKRELPYLAKAHVGGRELSPGVWVGLNADVSASAVLSAPCWIGDHVWVQDNAHVGPNAYIEAGTMIDKGAIVEDSYVGSHTYVGQLTEIRKSFAIGNGLLNWATGSSLEIVDEFLLSDLKGRNTSKVGGSLLGRCIALALLVTTWPVIAVAWLKNLGSGKPLFEALTAVPAPRPAHRMNAPAVRYSRLNGFRGVWSRWPELVKIASGRFAWIGNRPVAPEAVAKLENEFEELWLDAPTGLYSLSDLNRCEDLLGDESKAHASFYAVQADAKLRRRLAGNLISRALLG